MRTTVKPINFLTMSMVFKSKFEKVYFLIGAMELYLKTIIIFIKIIIIFYNF